MQERRVQVLLVDVDGVLVDGRPDDGKHWQSRLEEDLGISPAALKDAFFTPYWTSIVSGERDMLPLLSGVLARIAPWCHPQDLIDYWFRNDARIVAPLLDLLDEVRRSGLAVYLATNQEHRRAAYLMQTLGLARHCDGMLYSARIGALKPQAQFFIMAQAAIARPSEGVLLVDDSVQNVQAAHEAGWNGLHWSPHEVGAGLHALRTVLNLPAAT